MKKQILMNNIIFLFITFLKFTNSQINNCTYTDPVTTHIYNLTALKYGYDEGFYTAPIDSTVIKFNLCNEPISACAALQTCAACQLSNGNTKNIYKESETPSVTFTDVGFNFKFNALGSGGLDCVAGGGRRITNMYFTCDPNVDRLIVTKSNENPLCTYHIYVNSSYACNYCPIFNCSGHGVCDYMKTGECACDSQTTGLGCEISRLSISSTDSTTTAGGFTTLHGYFGQTTSNLSITIGSSQCTNIKVPSNSTIKCYIKPGTGIHDVIIKDNDLSYVSQNGFQYTPIVFDCFNNCTSPQNGVCNKTNGYCNCLDNYTGFDCGSIIDTDTPITIPSINNTNGEVIFTNEDSNFKVNIYSIVEFNFTGSIIKEYKLQNKWNVTSTNTTNTNGNKFIKYSQFINGSNNTLVEYTIEQILNNKTDFSFAGIGFTLLKDSIKMTISIQNYKYSSNLNKIQLRIQSSIGENSTLNGCNVDDLSTNLDNDGNNNQNFNYLTISKDKKTFSGRFINRMLSDGNIATMTTSIIKNPDNINEVYIGLNLPLCKLNCFIDPDFSVLVSQEYKKTCDEPRPKWFLPVVIAAPIVGLSIIIIVSAVIYKRHRVGIKILKQQMKLKNLNNN